MASHVPRCRQKQKGMSCMVVTRRGFVSQKSFYARTIHRFRKLNLFALDAVFAQCIPPLGLGITYLALEPKASSFQIKSSDHRLPPSSTHQILLPPRPDRPPVHPALPIRPSISSSRAFRA